jgi:hypothetical protein
MVLIDRFDEEDGRRVITARSYGEAPEIDPVIRIVERSRTENERANDTFLGRGAFRELSLSGRKPAPRFMDLREGQFVSVDIRAAQDYDLMATID